MRVRRRRLCQPTICGDVLDELNLAGCTHLCDASAEHACQHSPRLRRLTLSGCAALRGARLASGSLRELRCHAVTRSVVDAAADRLRCPRLRTIVCEAYAEVHQGFEEVD
jgi:hypothetical protein